MRGVLELPARDEELRPEEPRSGRVLDRGRAGVGVRGVVEAFEVLEHPPAPDPVLGELRVAREGFAAACERLGTSPRLHQHLRLQDEGGSVRGALVERAIDAPDRFAEAASMREHSRPPSPGAR